MVKKSYENESKAEDNEVDKKNDEGEEYEEYEDYDEEVGKEVGSSSTTEQPLVEKTSKYNMLSWM